MGKPITHEFTQGKTILKFFDYKGAACVVPKSMGKDDGSCKGYLLHDVDVTHGDAAGTYIYEGSIDNKKLTATGVIVGELAKAATPRVTFFD